MAEVERGGEGGKRSCVGRCLGGSIMTGLLHSLSMTDCVRRAETMADRKEEEEKEATGKAIHSIILSYC